MTRGSSPRGRGKRQTSRTDRPPTRLIPAWAGKTLSNEAMRLRRSGSSPRGRGKPDAHVQRSDLLGLIPAWAGKTSFLIVGELELGAHPRVGGENASSSRTIRPAPGSSPRGRGKPLLPTAPKAPQGLIPAWAGKTPPTFGRSCVGAGSSPRGRGKLPPLTRLAKNTRLIPAWAGKTFLARVAQLMREAHPRVGGENERTRASSSASSAHPRVGGENDIPPSLSPWRMGSSPRGRGKRDNTQQFFPHFGLIPAWAGKTTSILKRWQVYWAHPRVGGENSLSHTHARVTHGSSPRGRGKPSGKRVPRAARGLIPAWAGKTILHRLARCCVAAHPRVGGENYNAGSAHVLHAGSSPRGRGKLRAQ